MAGNHRCECSSLVVTQPSTSHYLLCVQCVLLCQVFYITANLSKKVTIFHQLFLSAIFGCLVNLSAYYILCSCFILIG